MKANSKIQSIDNLRVIATISVILLHVSASVALRYETLKLDVWWVGNIYDSFTRFCVPLFLMISGALLLNKEYAPMEFFRKRTVRILYPFLFWSLLYFVYYWYIQKPANRPIGFEAILQWAFELAKSGISYHFWFIYMLLGLYAVLPFVVSYFRAASTRSQHFICAFSLLFIVANSVGLYVFSTSVLLSNYFLSLVGYAGYMMLGYLLFNLQLNKRQSLVIGISVFLVGAIFTTVGTYYLTQSLNKFASMLYNFLSVNVLLEAVGIFIFFKNIELKSKALILIRDGISTHSFGIYFVHVMVLGFFFRSGIWWGMAHSAISIPLITLLALAVSFSIIWALKELPFGCYFAG